MNKKLFIFVLIYVGTIVLANFTTSRLGLVPIGFGLMVTAGTFFAGLTPVIRDAIQLHGRWMVVPAAIVVGAVLSAITSNPAIALASGIAFLFSEIVDWGVFTPIRDRSLWAAVVVSSVVSAPVDTILFLYLSGLGLSVPAVIGQFIVKTVIALALCKTVKR